MFKISTISDEISPQLSEQLDLLESEGIEYIEVRSIQKKNILDLSPEALQEVKQSIRNRRMKVSAISSPIGKIKLDEDYPAHFQRFLKAIEIANFFETDRIRIFGFYNTPLATPDNRNEIMKRIESQVKEAEKHQIKLLLENEDQTLYGGTSEQIMDVMDSIKSSSLGFLFDPGNYLYFFKKPVYPEFFNQTLDRIDYVHIKDIRIGESHFTEPGRGDVQYLPLLKELKTSGYDGFLSMEPHLKAGDCKGGFSGIEGVRNAIHAIKNIITEIE